MHHHHHHHHRRPSTGETRPDPVGATPVPERRQLVLLFIPLAVGLLLSELDQTVFATALPTLAGDLHGVDQMLWVTTAYVLTATITMPVYGRLSDLLGRKDLFLAALAVFVLGSVVGGVSPTMTWLIVGRAIQGLGGGGVLILVQAIVADVVPARQRAPYLSAIGAVFAVSALLGPVLGGWFAEGVGWRWAFWLNLPVGGSALILAAVFLPRSRRSVDRLRLDVWGFTTLSVAVGCLVLVAAEGGTRYAWTSTVVLTLIGAGLVAAVSFVLVERRAAQPLLPLHLFGNRTFTVATLAGLVTAVAMFGTIGYVPTYLQMVNGLTATRAGLTMLALVAGLGGATVVSARFVSRTGHYRWLPVIGAAVVAVALTLLSTLATTTPLVVLAGYLFLLGAGIGCSLEILVVVVQSTVAGDEVGIATAAAGFFREVGVSLGSAVVGSLFTSRLAAQLGPRVPTAGGGSLDPATLTPDTLRLLPEPVRLQVAIAYHDALTPVFLHLVPLLLASVVGLALLRPLTLATTLSEPAGTMDPTRQLADVG